MSAIIRKSTLVVNLFATMKTKALLCNLRQLRPFLDRCNFHTSVWSCKDDTNKPQQKALDVFSFGAIKDKEKKTYLDVLRIYVNRDIYRRGHVEFIYAAMKHMDEFGVSKDLEVYKALLDVLPKGKFIPNSMFQIGFMHFPKQQQCAIDLLEKMEDNAVMPDAEMETMLLNIFGKYGFPLRKYWRMMYWMPKFKNLSPWPLPSKLPDDSLELAKLAIERIMSVDLQRKITIFETKNVSDSVDDTWIVSGMSPSQQEVLTKHSQNVPIYVEGPFRLWLKNVSINYFILRADPVEKPESPIKDADDVSDIKFSFWNKSPVPSESTPTVHEQEDGTIFAVCATGTSSRDSLLSWIRCLEEENSILSKIPVLFTLKSPLGAIVVSPDEDKGTKETEQDKKYVDK